MVFTHHMPDLSLDYRRGGQITYSTWKSILIQRPIIISYSLTLTKLRFAIVVSLLESNLFEALLKDFVCCRHASIADRHTSSKPMKHCQEKKCGLRTTHLNNQSLTFFTCLPSLLIYQFLSFFTCLPSSQITYFWR